MNPLKPEKGEQYIGPDTGTIYEWDGEKWIDTGNKVDMLEKSEENVKGG